MPLLFWLDLKKKDPIKNFKQNYFLSYKNLIFLNNEPMAFPKNNCMKYFPILNMNIIELAKKYLDTGTMVLVKMINYMLF